MKLIHAVTRRRSRLPSEAFLGVNLAISQKKVKNMKLFSILNIEVILGLKQRREYNKNIMYKYNDLNML